MEGHDSSSVGSIQVFRAETSRSEWRRFQLAARRHLFPSFLATRTVSVAFAVLIGASLGALAALGPVGLVLGLLTLAAFVAVVLINARYSRRMCSAFATELTVEANDHEVTVTRAGVRTTFEWAAVTGWSEDRDCFFVSVAPLVGWPLPRSGFTSTAEATAFREQLAAVRPATR